MRCTVLTYSQHDLLRFVILLIIFIFVIVIKLSSHIRLNLAERVPLNNYVLIQYSVKKNLKIPN